MSFKDFSNFSTDSHFQSRPICAIMVEGIMGNISVKLCKFGTVDQMFFEKKGYTQDTAEEDRSE